jgi:uncharacterized protein
MTEEFIWHNEPPQWSMEKGYLELSTGQGTDFWRTTYYGYNRDSGHAYLQPVNGDFSVSAALSGQYETLYDQTGLMLRIDENYWIKAGVEFTSGRMHFSTVITNGTSDWSMIPMTGVAPQTPVLARLSRIGSAVQVHYKTNETDWQLVRLGPFPDRDGLVGMTACSPSGSGFVARFEQFAVGPAVDAEQ